LHELSLRLNESLDKCARSNYEIGAWSREPIGAVPEYPDIPDGVSLDPVVGMR